MSRHETWRTRQYWQKVGGILVEEFKAEVRTAEQGRRLLDGVIIIDQETKIHEKNHYDITDRDVICIQTKKTRLGMYVMGQAFFSRELLKKYNPKSIRTVIICGKNDKVLSQLCAEHQIEVIVIPDKDEFISNN